MAAPTLTPEQRDAALESARKTRQKRAEVMEKLRTGKLKHATALDKAKDDPVIGKIRLLRFLMTIQGVGKVRAEAFMAEHGIPESRRLQGLGVNQIELVKAFAAK